MGREQYYEKKINRHREMADYHAHRAEGEANPDYHKQQEIHHREQVDKLLQQRDNRKKKPVEKDLLGSIGGPTTSTPGPAMPTP